MANESDTPDPMRDAEVVLYGEVVASRVEEAYRLRLQGKTFTKIADELGYTSGLEVAQAIRSRMKSEATRLTIEDRESLLQMEMDRLNALRTAHWEAAMLGDDKSTEICLKITDRMIKVGQLDAMDTKINQAAVLVISGNEQDYVNKLKELSNETD